MKTIKTLKLGELSLVDTPANPLAKAPIFKRDTSNEDKMTDEVMSEEMDKKIKDYMKAKGCDRKTAEAALMKSYELEEENQKLRKALIDNGFVINKEGVEKRMTPEYIEIDGEKIEKSSVPAPILKKLEAAEKAEVEAKLEKRAKELLPNFDVEVAKGILKFDLDEKILEALKAADAAFEAAMDETGETNSQEVDPRETLNKMAKEKAKEDSITFEKAYSQIVMSDQGKELLKAMKETK